MNIADDEMVLLSDEELQKFFCNNLFKQYMKEITKYPVATNKSNKKYYNDYCNGDLNAREMLIKTNLRLVVNIVIKYKKRIVNLQLLDIIQEGNLGLMRAIETYDPSGSSFTVYACLRIKSAVGRAICNKEQIIRQSVSLQEKINQYLKIINNYTRRNKPIPSKRKLCNMLEVTEQRLNDIIDGSKFQVISLEETVTKIQGLEIIKTKLLDNIGDSQSNKTDEIIKKVETQEIYVLLREILRPIEYFIMYYHILADNKILLEDIAKIFGVTRERIRQIEVRMKTKIKKYISNDRESLKLTLTMIRKREGDKFYQIKQEPISLNYLLEYMYIRDSLTFKEQEYFKLRYLSKYEYQENEIIKSLDLETDEYLEFINNLEEKLRYLMADVRKFRSFKKQMFKTYGTDIIRVFQNDNSTTHVIDYLYLYKRYANCSLNEIYGIFRNVWKVLSFKEIEQLYNFFPISRVGLTQQGTINGRDINHIWRILDRLEQKKLELESNPLTLKKV